MGQLVRNVTYNAATKVLSFEGLHGGTFDVVFDDAADAHMQGGAKPAKSGSVTLDRVTGKGTYDTTSKAFTVGTKHTVRFVDPIGGHVTLRSDFVA